MISRPLCARIDADCAPGRKPREPAFHLLFQSGERECAGTPDLISGQPELKAGRGGPLLLDHLECTRLV